MKLIKCKLSAFSPYLGICVQNAQINQEEGTTIPKCGWTIVKKLSDYAPIEVMAGSPTMRGET